MADTIAFGDAKVDIPMLEYCGYGVAMGSGGDEIKAMADYVTGDVDQNGLYDAFENSLGKSDILLHFATISFLLRYYSFCPPKLSLLIFLHSSPNFSGQ